MGAVGLHEAISPIEPVDGIQSCLMARKQRWERLKMFFLYLSFSGQQRTCFRDCI